MLHAIAKYAAGCIFMTDNEIFSSFVQRCNSVMQFVKGKRYLLTRSFGPSGTQLLAGGHLGLLISSFAPFGSDHVTHTDLTSYFPTNDN